MSEKQKMMDRGMPDFLAEALTGMGVTADQVVDFGEGLPPGMVTEVEFPGEVQSDNSPDTLDMLRKLRNDNAPDPRAADGTVSLNRDDIIDLLHALHWVHSDLMTMLDQRPSDVRALMLDGKIHQVANKLVTVLDTDSPLTSIPF